MEHRLQIFNIWVSEDYSTHGSKMLLLRKLLLTCFFRFFCWLDDDCAGRATPPKMRCSLHTKPSALSTHWEIFPFPALFLTVWVEKIVIFFMSFPWAEFQTSALTPAIQKSVGLLCLNESASWIDSGVNQLIKDLMWTWGLMLVKRIPAFSSCCKNWMNYCWSVYQT